MTSLSLVRWFLLFTIAGSVVRAQPLGEPDTGAPGDAMIQAYLARETAKLAARWSPDVASREAWDAKRPQYQQEYLYMLGLSPFPERSEGSRPGPYPIPPESLRVFPADADIPADQINTTIDERFVPIAQPPNPASGQHAPWKEKLLGELRRVSFSWFEEPIPHARELREVDARTLRMESEEGIEFELRFPQPDQPARAGVLLAVLNAGEAGTVPDWVRMVSSNRHVVLCEPRGIGATRWTTRNPPNYVERSHALLGRTVDAGRVWDVISAIGYLADSRRVRGQGERRPVHVAGRGAAGVIAAYAALLSRTADGVILVDPPGTHLASAAPQLLNCLRVCDIPDVLGMLAPRPLTLIAPNAARDFGRTLSAYSAAGAPDQVKFQ
jgi:hypothetical protein